MREDDTEPHRRQLIAEGYPEQAAERAEQRWTTDQLRADFDVLSFLAPFVIVRRKSDGKKGTVMFKHSPRVYFNFMED
jgi:hypothetical protein